MSVNARTRGLFPQCGTRAQPLGRHAHVHDGMRVTRCGPTCGRAANVTRRTRPSKEAPSPCGERRGCARRCWRLTTLRWYRSRSMLRSWSMARLRRPLDPPLPLLSALSWLARLCTQALVLAVLASADSKSRQRQGASQGGNACNAPATACGAHPLINQGLRRHRTRVTGVLGATSGWPGTVVGATSCVVWHAPAPSSSAILRGCRGSLLCS